MMNNIVVTIDVATGEVVEREMNEEELTQLQLNQQKALEEQDALEQKANAVQSAKDKLSALGLSEEEISAIISGGI
jgi:hypothetical protein